MACDSKSQNQDLQSIYSFLFNSYGKKKRTFIKLCHGLCDSGAHIHVLGALCHPGHDVPLHINHDTV